MNLTVTIDNHSGFCWGVVRTIAIAENELNNEKELYSLGEIIHNPKEIERLKELGLKTIDSQKLNELDNNKSRILIRAHGAPPDLYKRAMELNLEIVDATCPVVTKLQERIRKYYDNNYQIIIFGKKDHAEVLGLRGVTNDECIVIKNVDEALSKADFSRNTVLFSQTTMDKPTFNAIKDALSKKISNLIVDSAEEIAVEFHSKDTICGQVSGREKKLREFANQNDVIIFVAGKLSSNGKVLYDICKECNQRTYFIEDADEIQNDWFKECNTVGITGATSTPQWLMEKIKDYIETNF